MTENLEGQIIEILATDRIDVPISSMSGKLKRAKPKLAKAVNLGEYEGNFSEKTSIPSLIPLALDLSSSSILA